MIDTAIILAAGKGTKIWPYSDTWPKAALPIANKAIIEWQMETLEKCGIKRFIIVVGHCAGQVRNLLQTRSDCTFIDQLNQRGTADAVSKALPQIDSEAFLAVYGDVLFDSVDIQAMIDCFQSNNKPTALVQNLKSRSPQEWLCANLKDNTIQQILGHPREAPHRLCGIYALNRSVIPFIENNPGIMASVEVGNMPPSECELAESLSQYIQSGSEVCAVESQSIYEDIDKPWHYLDANTNWLKHICSKISTNNIAPSAKVSNNAEIDGYIVVEEESIVGDDVKIKGNLIVGNNTVLVDGPIIGENTVIGNHAIVREYCKIEPFTSIGHHCIAGHATEFGGIMMNGAYAYHYGEYWGILGRSSDLGAATVCGTLRFDDQETIHRTKSRRDITNSPSANASYLGDYVRTGVNAILMPGIKVGPYSVVGAGVLLNEDLPNNSSIYLKQELIRSKWGPERYGW